MFWHYFQSLSKFPVVEKEVNYPCRKMELNQKRHLFRVLYYKNKVSFETFHSVTDGTGAICFLNSLLSCYFNLEGKNIDTRSMEINYKDKPSIEECEDSFKKVADDSGTNKRDNKKAYQVHGTPEPNGVLDVITAVCDSDKLHQIAKEHNATITQFLVAIYAKSIIQNQFGRSKKPVIISVPINLRKYFDTKTLRNFSSWVDIVFENGSDKIDIDELINISKQKMEILTKEYLLKNINTNIKTEKNFFVRIMP